MAVCPECVVVKSKSGTLDFVEERDRETSASDKSAPYLDEEDVKWDKVRAEGVKFSPN
jgi:hypothetical protein